MRTRSAAVFILGLFAVSPLGLRAQTPTDPPSDYVHVLRQVVAVLNQPPGTHNLFVTSPAETPQHLRLRRARWDRGHRHAVEMFTQAGRGMDSHFSDLLPGQLPDDALPFIKAFLLVKLPVTDHADDVKKSLVAAETALNIMTAANVPTENPPPSPRPRAKPTPSASVRANAAACGRLRDEIAAGHRILETTKRGATRHVGAHDAADLEATFLDALRALIVQTAAQRRARCR